MQVTETRVHLTNEQRLKAFVSITFDNCFAVRNIKVVEGNSGLLVCMPSRKTSTAQFKDVAHPITQDFRDYLEKTILQAYYTEVEAQAKQTQNSPSSAQP